LAAGARSCIVILFLAPLIRLSFLIADPGSHDFFRHFESAADPIAVGCLLATKRPGKKVSAFISSDWAIILAFGVILASSVVSKLVWQAGVITVSLVALAGGVIIFSLSQRQNRSFALFSSRPLVWLGGISYSLYLWQQMFLMAPHPLGPISVFSFPFNLGLAVVCATGSYYLVEKPLRNWGRTLLGRHRVVRVLDRVETTAY